MRRISTISLLALGRVVVPPSPAAGVIRPMTSHESPTGAADDATTAAERDESMPNIRTPAVAAGSDDSVLSPHLLAKSGAAPAASTPAVGLEEREEMEFNTVNTFGGKVRLLIKQIETYQTLKRAAAENQKNLLYPSFSSSLSCSSASIVSGNEQETAPTTLGSSSSSPELTFSQKLLHPPPLLPSRKQSASVGFAARSHERATRKVGVLVDQLNGGWVCLTCDTITPSRFRTVCSKCRTVRPDIASIDLTDQWGRIWRCFACKEVNRIGRKCVCCGADPPHPSRNLALKSLPLGAAMIINDSCGWWKCSACGTNTRATSTACSSCQAFRYAEITPSIQCRECSGDIPVSPEGITYDATKCWIPDFRCPVCQSHAHGGKKGLSYFCACGVLCHTRASTCRQCRLPQHFPSPAVKDKILQSWNFSTFSSWCCLSCYQTNKTCYVTVGLVKARKSRVYHKGDVTCTNEACGKRWHGEKIMGGGWRCACGNVHVGNSDADVEKSWCRVCGRPYAIKDDTKAITFWMKGDKLCSSCKTHLHRHSQRCFECGIVQPTDPSSAAPPSL